MKQIDNFIKKLSLTAVSEETTNLYAGKSKASMLRRENLRLYLNSMYDRKPTVLVLGEAPGYKGCRLTGVPFSSERILNENDFFRNQKYAFLNDQEDLESEMSATLVWNELDQFSSKPLIWNIFPFHPHKVDQQRCNRTPNRKELEMGALFLNDLLSIFRVKSIVALGRKAESKIKDLGYTHKYVRHPANGGKQQFVIGIREVLNSGNH